MPPPPRYSDRSFPPYAFVPGRDPHPRRDPRGYAHGQPEPAVPPLDPARWIDSDDYRHGIDLFNHGYWWACHEALEALWHASGHATPVGQALQAVIQVAAACLKSSMGEGAGARRLWTEGLARVAASPDRFLGIDLRTFERDARDYFEGRRGLPPHIVLVPDTPAGSAAP